MSVGSSYMKETCDFISDHTINEPLFNPVSKKKLGCSEGEDLWLCVVFAQKELYAEASSQLFYVKSITLNVTIVS